MEGDLVVMLLGAAVSGVLPNALVAVVEWLQGTHLVKRSH